MTTSNLFQYADDTLIFSQHLIYQRAIEMLQADVTKIMDWFLANKLRVNASKTKLICFHNPLKNVSLTSPLFLHDSSCSCDNCRPVEYVDSVKYLGLNFDCDLSWNTHMSYICQRLRTVSCLLYHIKGFLPLSLKENITHALAYSILRYGITVFF